MASVRTPPQRLRADLLAWRGAKSNFPKKNPSRNGMQEGRDQENNLIVLFWKCDRRNRHHLTALPPAGKFVTKGLSPPREHLMEHARATRGRVRGLAGVKTTRCFAPWQVEAPPTQGTPRGTHWAFGLLEQIPESAGGSAPRDLERDLGVPISRVSSPL